MKKLTRHTIVAIFLGGLVWFVEPGPGQEPAKASTRGQAVPPGANSQPPGGPDDDDEASLREFQARRSLQENCLICHTEDLIAGQRLTPVQWKAEIEKMVNWGSPLPKEAAVPLIDYLSRHYSDRTAPSTPARATLEDVDSLEVPGHGRNLAPVNGDLERGMRLFATNCATCHGPSALGGELGPSLVNKAILVHPREYDQILRQGLRRMPGFPAVMSTKDRADVLAWLRSRTYPE
jgi:Cytochrome C oxidase, cbb3-type, subunit III